MLSPEEELEAKRFAEIAALAEAKAAKRATNNENNNGSTDESPNRLSGNAEDSNGLKFLTKKEREELALQRLQQSRLEAEARKKEALKAHERFVTGQAVEEKKREARIQREREEMEKIRRQKEENKEAKEHEQEVKAIHEHYLGGRERKRKIAKPSEKFAKIFQFDWEGEHISNFFYQK